jgi:hypothetical protein
MHERRGTAEARIRSEPSPGRKGRRDWEPVQRDERPRREKPIETPMAGHVVPVGGCNGVESEPREIMMRRVISLTFLEVSGA